MALDEPKDDDKKIEENGITFVVDSQTSDILSQGGGLTIDYVNEAYRKGYMLKLGNASDCSPDDHAGGCSGCG